MEDFALQKCEIAEIETFLFYNGESDFDVERLVLHRQMFFDHIKSEKIVLDDLTKISIYLQKNKEVGDFCSEYKKFIKLLLTAPQRKTNDLALLYIHRDIANEMDMDALDDEFILRATVRKNTFALKNET